MDRAICEPAQFLPVQLAVDQVKVEHGQSEL